MKQVVYLVPMRQSTLELLKKVSVGEHSAAKLKAEFNQRTFELSISQLAELGAYIIHDDLLLFGRANIEGKSQRIHKLNRKVKLIEAGQNYVKLEVDM